MQPLLRTSRLSGGHRSSYKIPNRTTLTSRRQALLPPIRAVKTSRQLRGHDLPGQKPWEGVVDWDKEEMNDELRAALITYGELIQAAYDNLNTDANRPNACGLPRYDCDSMLSFSVPAHPKPTTADKYKVTNFFLANNFYNPDITIFNAASNLLAQLVINQLFKAPKTEPDRPVWLGYIALSQDTNEAKDVAVVFRGTIFEEEWKLNINGDWMVNWEKEKLGSSTDMRVHQGFYDLYTNPLDWEKKQTAKQQAQRRAQEGFTALFRGDLETEEGRKAVKEFWGKDKRAPYQVIEGELKKLLTENDVATITTTGHSLGAALATISALHIAERLETEFPKWLEANPNMKTKVKPAVTGFPFASPRVGGLAMLERVTTHPNLKILRITNARDMVPQVPGFYRLLSTIVFGPDLLQKFGTDGRKRGMEPAAPDGLWPLGVSIIPLRFFIMRLWRGMSKMLGFIGSAIGPDGPPVTLGGVPWDYFHVGQMLVVDSGCKSVKATIRPLGALDFGPKHNNEVYLHLVSAQWGGDLLARQPALMNKSDDVVAAQWQVPVGWWTRNTTTMEYDNEAGKWVALDMVTHTLEPSRNGNGAGNGNGNGNGSSAVIEKQQSSRPVKAK